MAAVVVECLSETITAKGGSIDGKLKFSLRKSEHRKSIEKFLIEMEKSLKEKRKVGEEEVFMANPTSWLLRSL